MPPSIQDVDSLLEQFQALEDPRVNINRQHLLGDLIVISIMAVIAGADGPLAIGAWAENNKRWLTKRLILPHGILPHGILPHGIPSHGIPSHGILPHGIPSHDTIGRLLAALKPSAFQQCFESWIASVSVPDDVVDLNQIAIDGKVLRRSHDRRRGLGPLWLVSAVARQCCGSSVLGPLIEV